jgi:hypothetical protein
MTWVESLNEIRMKKEEDFTFLVNVGDVFSVVSLSYSNSKAVSFITFSTFATFAGGFEDGDLECFLMDESFMVQKGNNEDFSVTFSNVGLILSDFLF